MTRSPRMMFSRLITSVSVSGRHEMMMLPDCDRPSVERILDAVSSKNSSPSAPSRVWSFCSSICTAPSSRSGSALGMAMGFTHAGTDWYSGWSAARAAPATTHKSPANTTNAFNITPR